MIPALAAGGDRSKGSGVLCAGALELSFTRDALAGGSPQLNHDPLGSAGVSGVNEESHLEPAVFLAALLIFVGIPAFTVIKVARLRASRPQASSVDVTARLEALERGVQDLRQELAETQERLDFTERLLSKAREERRIGS